MSLGRAGYTLFVSPEHEKLHQAVEDFDSDRNAQPLHPSINETVRLLEEDILPRYNLLPPPMVDGSQLIHLGGVLIQFGDYIPKQHSTIQVPYKNIHGLHEAVTRRAGLEGPLNYAQQLETALEQTDGNLTESLWRLFMTSRFYARWLDGKLVKDLPNYSRNEKITLMLEWRNSIAACKDQLPDRAQDPNGDTYYTWTHALAKTALVLTPREETATTRAATRVFENGTSIMHRIVHTFNKQSVRSDHSVAAAHGNAIGQTIVDHVLRSDVIFPDNC